MTTRRPSLIFFSKDLMVRDGVGNSVRSFQSYFESLGYDTKLVAQNSDDTSVLSIDQYLSNHFNHNVLFYHFSIADAFGHQLLDLKWRKSIIYFHGITPPNLLDLPISSECESGLLQIRSLPDFDLYLCNSISSSQQYNRFSNRKIRLDICPPIIANLLPAKSPSLSCSNHLHVNKLIFLLNSSPSPHKSINALSDFLNKLSHYYDVRLNYISRSSYPVPYEKCLYQLVEYIDIDDSSMEQVYRDSCIYISFSLHEGYSIPFFLSLHLGLVPCIKASSVANEYLPNDFNFLSSDPTPDEFKLLLPNLIKSHTYYCDYSFKLRQSLIESSLEKISSLIKD